MAQTENVWYLVFVIAAIFAVAGAVYYFGISCVLGLIVITILVIISTILGAIPKAAHYLSPDSAAEAYLRWLNYFFIIVPGVLLVIATCIAWRSILHVELAENVLRSLVLEISNLNSVWLIVLGAVLYSYVKVRDDPVGFGILSKGDPQESITYAILSLSMKFGLPLIVLFGYLLMGNYLFVSIALYLLFVVGTVEMLRFLYFKHIVNNFDEIFHLYGLLIGTHKVPRIRQWEVLLANYVVTNSKVIADTLMAISLLFSYLLIREQAFLMALFVLGETFAIVWGFLSATYLPKRAIVSTAAGTNMDGYVFRMRDSVVLVTKFDGYSRQIEIPSSSISSIKYIELLAKPVSTNGN